MSNLSKAKARHIIERDRIVKEIEAQNDDLESHRRVTELGPKDTWSRLVKEAREVLKK